MIGPSTVGIGVEVELGSGEGVAVRVTVGKVTVEVVGNAGGDCVTLGVAWGSHSVEMNEETVCDGEAMSSSTEG